MKLDLFTIYVFIVFLGCSFSIAWLVVWRSYATVRGPGTWLISNLCAVIGSGAVAYSYVHPSAVITIGAHVLIALALALLWAGLRQFYNLQVPWVLLLLWTGVIAVALTVFHDDPVALRFFYSLSGALPFLLMARDLLRDPAATPASRLCAIAMGIATLGELMTFVAVLAYATNIIPEKISNPLAIVSVLLAIFGCVSACFGFLLAAMEKVRSDLSALVIADDLTGIGSRRYFLERIEAEVVHARRVGSVFCLLMIDLDRFKDINDAYGHAAGDQCLRHFARVASERIRRTDLLARTGGDEFCLILPDTTIGEGMRVVDDLLRAVRQHVMTWEGIELPFTASIGIVQWDPASPQTVEQLRADVDQALYRAKQGGRDRGALKSAS